jgi:hypothetical protein
MVETATFSKEVLTMNDLQNRKPYESPVVVVDSGFEKEVLSSGPCLPIPDALGECTGYSTPSA